MLTAMLTPEPFPTAQRLRLRLPRLAACGLVDRPARRRALAQEQQYELYGDRQPRGRPEDIWALAQRGADILGLTGDWNKNNGRLHAGAFTHPLMISRFYTTLRVAEAQRLIDLEAWKGENVFRMHVVVAGQRLPIVPDATFHILDQRSAHVAPIFFEADNHTEPLVRNALSQSSFFKKCLAYWHYWDQRLRPHKQPMLVLTVAKTAAGVERLQETAARVDGARRRGLNLFWFTSEEQWDTSTPERLLYEPIWTTAAGQQLAIFRK